MSTEDDRDRGIRLAVRSVADGVVALDWDPTDDWEALRTALVRTTEDALAGGARRIEIDVASVDRSGRRAALRAGFRQEGVRRQVRPTAAGWDDVIGYARLADDVVGGSAGFTAVMNTALPRKRLIAHVIIRDRDRLLLCETRFKADWELPGGIVEPHEAPRLGAYRELIEELGVERQIGRLLIVDWMPAYLGWDDAIELIFDGGELASSELGDLVLEPHEISAVRLCTLDEAQALVTELSHRRLTIAMSLAAGETAYLENGNRIS